MTEQYAQPLSTPDRAALATSENVGETCGASPATRGTRLRAKLPAVTRIYVWSVILEPLLFFVLWDRLSAGVSGNLSRLLQGVVIIALILKNLLRPSGLVMVRFSSKLYRNFAFYMAIAVLAGAIGALSGAYRVSVSSSTGEYQSVFAGLLNSPAVRPLFEYFIIIYQLAYFVVLPRYLLKTERSVAYFFSAFRKMFFLSLLIGFVDLACAAVYHELVPRHIADWVYVGFRFHGLAGEPRDAFVYLFLGLAVLHLEAYTKGKSLNRLLVLTIITASLLTQSASGLIGVAIFIFLFAFESVSSKMNVRRFLLLGSILLTVPIAVYVAVASSDRLLEYMESASDLWYLLESRTALPYLMMVQSPNIYPLYDLTVKAREMNILPILIGSGLGSASAVNNLYNPLAGGELSNPNSQLVRALFEYGLAGTFFFIRSFVYPIKELTRGIAKVDRFTFILLSLLLMGCFLGQRSAAPFIYLGIFFAVFAPRCTAAEPLKRSSSLGSESVLATTGGAA